MSLRHALLGQLAYGPASGYDLLRTFKTTLANVWPATQSQIYSELIKMADAGFLAVAAKGPRGRKEYRLTDAGLVELRHWLAETRPEKVVRNEMLLRVFLLGTVTPTQARAYMTDLQQVFLDGGNRLAALEESIDWDEGDLSVYGYLTLEWGKRFFAMSQEWLDWALGRMPQPAADSL